MEFVFADESTSRTDEDLTPIFQDGE